MKQSDEPVTGSSPQMQLANLCYELRHQMSLLEEALRKKEALLSTREAEAVHLKRRLVEVESKNSEESECSLSSRIDMDNDRLRLMAEVSRLESRLRSAECTISQQREELKNFAEQNTLLREELAKHVKLDSVIS